MKKIKIKLLLCVGLALMYSSCADLDKQSDNYFEHAWETEYAGTLSMNYLYNVSLPSAGFGNNALDTDESTNPSNWLSNQLTSSDYRNFAKESYARIRALNLEMERCKKSPLSETIKNEFLGQMHFLRAYEYFQMVLRHGGVSIVLEAHDPFKMTVADMNKERSTAKVCFEQILKDLDAAATMCKPNMSDYGDKERGRVTQLTALALKSRVYLTFASPLFNPQNDQKRWVDAYNACLEAKTRCEAQGRTLLPDFGSLFLTEGIAANPEVVWVVPYDYTGGKTHGWENSFRPASMANRGTAPGCIPSMQLTDAFPMKDGKKIGTSSTYSYNQQLYWVNRDPRLSATIAYNGSVWGLNGNSGRKQWTYIGMEGEKIEYMATLGSYCRKGSNPNILSQNSAGENTKETGTDWIEIRYAEILLNLAECANEAGHSSEAYAELYSIRKRAGIEEGTNMSERYGITSGLSKEDLREIILNERFIEFAFEGKRFWDLHRRLMFTERISANTPSLNDLSRRSNYMVRPKAPNTAATIDPIRDKINIDVESPTYFNIIATQRDAGNLNIKVPKRYYFIGVPKATLETSIKVQQTIGWIDERDPNSPAGTGGQMGTFDPLSDQGGTPWKDEL